MSWKTLLALGVLLLSIGLDFVSATMSIMADAVLVGGAVALLWPTLWDKPKS